MTQVIDELFISLGFKGNDALKGIKKTSEDLDKLKKKSEESTETFMAFRTSIVLAVGAFAGLAGIVQSNIKNLVNLKYTSENLDFPIEEIIKYKLAWEKTGSTQDAFVQSLGGINKALVEFRTGSGVLLDDDVNGLLVNADKGFLGFLKNPETKGIDVLLRLSDIIKKLYDKDPSKGLILSERLGLTESINPLKKGSQAIKVVVADQAQFVNEIKDSADQAVVYNRLLGDMKNRFEKIHQALTIKVLPKFLELQQYLVDFGNRFPTLSEQASLFFDGVGTGLEGIIYLFDKLFLAVDKVLGVIPDAVNGIMNSRAVRIAQEKMGEALEGASPVTDYLANKAESISNYVSPYFSGIGEDKKESIHTEFGSEFLNKKLKAASIKYGFSLADVKYAFNDAAKAEGLRPELLMAQAYQESEFYPKAHNDKSGATGFSQFMPGTAKQYGLTNPRDPITSIYAQAKYMGDLSRKFNGDENKMLAGYNWGENHKSLQRSDWRNSLPDETRVYLSAINAYSHAPNMQPMQGNSSGSTNIHIGNLTVKANDVNAINAELRGLKKPAMIGQFNTGLR